MTKSTFIFNFLIQLNNVSLKDEWEKFKLLMSFYIIVFNVKLHSLIKMQRMQHFLSKRQISMELFKICLLYTSDAADE